MREINKTRGIFADKISVADEKDYVSYVVNELTDEINERKALGLCAPQLGYFARIICLNLEGTVKEFVNPVLRRADSVSFVKETCLSLDDDSAYLVPRQTDIDVYYQDKKGKMQGCTLKGIAATTFMQLYEILLGIFIDDLYEKVPENFDELSEEEQSNYLQEYAKRLEKSNEDLDNEIKEDPELKEMSDKMEAYKVLSLAELKGRTDAKSNLNRATRRGLQKIVDKKVKKK